MKLFVALSLGVACWVVCPEASAQITNVLNKVRDDGSDGLGVEITGRADWRSGNVNRVDLLGAATVLGRVGRHVVLASAAGQFAVRDDERFIARHLEHLRYRVKVAGPLSAEAFVQHHFNEFRRRAVRGLFGAGPRIVLPMPEGMGQAFGLAYMPEYELFSEGEDEDGVPFADSGVGQWHHRLSSYSTTGVKVLERVNLTYTVFFQPAFNDIGNLRMFSELGVGVQVVGPLKLDFSWVVQLDTQPPQSVRSTDSRRLLGLTLKI